MKKRILGFTLIELLIVITIIGILSVVFIPSFLNAPAKARDAVRISDLSNIVQSIAAGSIDSPVVADPSAGCVSTALASYAKYFGTGAVPVDPKPANPAVGGSCTDTTDAGQYGLEVYTSGNAKYGIYARLENKNGNIACPTAAITATPTLLTTANGECQLSLFSK